MTNRDRTILPALAAVAAVAALLFPPPAASRAEPAGAEDAAERSVERPVERPEQIDYPPLPAVEIPRPERHVLDNGLVVMLLEDHELPLVGANLVVRTGSRHEPADKVGLASLTGGMLRAGGTESMTPDELDLFLESQAASIETFISTSSGGASMSCLSEDLADVLPVFAEVLRAPRFDPERLAVQKTQVETSIARQNDDPVGIMFREFGQMLLGEESPYARRPTYASLAAIERADLVEWHRTYYHPERMILGMVGDFDSGEALELVKSVFGGWPRGAEVEVEPVPVEAEVTRAVHFAEKADVTQSNISMGHLGIRRDNPDYFAVEVMNQVLSGSFASRLFSNIRSTKGLAYAVSGGVGSEWDHRGIFRMWMTTKVESTVEAIRALIEEAENMTAKPPTDEEVAKAKDGILESFVFNFDSTGEILGQQIVYEYHGFPLDWLTKYRAGIEAVTTAEVRAAAEKYIHPEKMAILVVGPSQEGLEEFGEVETVDISIPPPPGAPAQ